MMNSKYSALGISLLLMMTAAAQQSHTIHSNGNPILGDGSYYSADPAPVVAGDTLYILAGRDEAPENVNDFVMKEWQIFATKDVSSRRWQHYPGILCPETLFSWAAPGHAYAGQIIQGPDHRYYLYAPVQEANSHNEDTFAIGVAIADTPLGPWQDAHPSGPIISQSVPERNSIQNIDPTPFVDEDGRVFIYWGTFGQLRGMELDRDMVSPKGREVAVESLTGFFEAPWLFKRGGTYYMVYADNQAGPNSSCTPAVYHACIAYGTASNPLGPWTYRDVILNPVSSTTSHPGVIEFKDKWYLVYHTADAKGGTHFRRSVAIDILKWDDSTSPARIMKVEPTRRPQPPAPPSRNIAAAARPSASNEPVPVQYWIGALNDGIIRANPLPPDMWGSWTSRNPASQWIQYEWVQPVTLNGSRIYFWADHKQGAVEGVAPPKEWRLEYWKDGHWASVPNVSGYPVAVDHFVDVHFDPIATRCLRAVLTASGEGAAHAAVAVEEWEALTLKPVESKTMPGAAPVDGICNAKE